MDMWRPIDNQAAYQEVNEKVVCLPLAGSLITLQEVHALLMWLHTMEWQRMRLNCDGGGGSNLLFSLID